MKKTDKIFHSAAGTLKEFASNVGANIPIITKAVTGVNPVYKSNKKIRQAQRDTHILRQEKAYDKAPDRNNDGSMSPAGMTRSLANEVRQRIKKPNYNK